MPSLLHRSGRLLLVLLAAGWPGLVSAADGPSPADLDFFETQVRPLLAQHCYRCHGPDQVRAGLRLDSREAILSGGRSGAAAVPGKPDESLVIQAVAQTGDLKMPYKEPKLSDQEVERLKRWVQLGLPWPVIPADKVTASKPRSHFTEDQRHFWAFQPVRPVPAPVVKDSTWAHSDLDRFILAALEARGLHPARPADKRTLIRRATFDLTGLPPTPQEVDAFLADDSPQAFARVVDRLLASPHYGERWGRHWLDLVRYTDSFDSRILSGDGTVMDCNEAWRYRDWVVDAFNHDLPYDQFILNQIAGDLLPAAHPGEVNVPGIVATGMLAIGDWGGGDADKEKLLTDIADDQVDVLSRTFMGLTVACARCHDHKFDPISTEDYYGLAGIFFSSHILPNVGPKTNGPPMLRIPLLSAEEMARRNNYPKQVAELEKRLQEASEEPRRSFARAQLPQTGRYLLAAWDYQHRPTSAGNREVTVAEFAASRNLHPFALQQWLDYLGLDDYRPMNVPLRDLLGHRGVQGWRGEADCPSLLVNTNNHEETILTFKMPPRSVTVHPGPTNGVAVAWKSPFTGTVRVTGRVADADPAGGDGIAWAIDQRQAGGRSELAAGEFPNGGAQKLTEGKTAERLNSVAVRAGETLELVVLPKANHVCDTTVVELTITATDGSATWDLTHDLLDDPLEDGKGNPHRDSLGHAAVWSFLDMAGSNRAARTADRTALADWDHTAAAVAAGTAGRDQIERAAQDFQKTFTLDDARSPFWIRDRADEKLLPAEKSPMVAKLAAELDALKKNPPPPVPMAHGVQEGGVPGSPHEGVHDVHVHMRGRYDRLGKLVPRHFPEILAGDQQPPITEGSGRLQLARWLARPEHPLTARVLVNRLWQQHFGQGIVRSPSNFGQLGERPSHPELLDYLARQFVESGWSIKQMHRLMMLSATYQQASEPDPATFQADPDNHLFGWLSRRRLEAEEVRDSLLAVSGRLDPTLGGRATRDFNSPRRTLYQLTVRSDRSGFGPLFDAADPTSPVAVRTVSTVAPQALFLLNHPFVREQTKTLARRVQASAGDDRGRLEQAYRLLYGRSPREEEVRLGLAFLARAGGGEQGWQEYCQLLLCANEFVYID